MIGRFEGPQKEKLPQKNQLLRELRAMGTNDNKPNDGPLDTHGMEDELLCPNGKRVKRCRWIVDHMHFGQLFYSDPLQYWKLSFSKKIRELHILKFIA